MQGLRPNLARLAGAASQTARSALDAIAAIVGPQAAETIRQRGGRPVKPERKIDQTLRLTPELLEAYKQQGPGWRRT